MTLYERHVKASLEVAGIIGVAALSFPTWADPDLWGHVRFGMDIVAARALPAADVYAFTSDRPWINHEWLSEVLMAASYSAGGAWGLIALKLALLAVFVATTWLALRFAGATPLWRFIGVAFSVVASLALLHSVRPQLWSLACSSTLLAILSRRSARWLLAAPLLFVVWVNSHGGWVIGMMILVIWLAEDTIAGRLSAKRAFGTVVACSCATLVNPYGYRLLVFLGETVRMTRDDITEWDPVVTSKPYLVIWSLGILVLARAALRRPAVRLVAPLVLAYLSWKVQRVTPFFALVTMVTALPAAAKSENTRDTVERRLIGRDRIAAGVIAALALTISGLCWNAVAQRTLPCIAIPADGPDQQAAAEITRLGLRGRMVTLFDWGEYAIWQFGPRLQVSMDGRRETVYTPGTIDQYLGFLMSGFNGWPALEQLQPDYIWLPKHVPATELIAKSGWIPIVSTQRSFVWARTSSVHRTRTSELSPRQTDRCFPGGHS
jgi:hypothetical protein